jgi:hypothetical protein
MKLKVIPVVCSFVGLSLLLASANVAYGRRCPAGS